MGLTELHTQEFTVGLYQGVYRAVYTGVYCAYTKGVVGTACFSWLFAGVAVLVKRRPG